jgi:hypothetical protein
MGCGTAASARDQLASHALSSRPVSTTIGGQLSTGTVTLVGRAASGGLVGSVG